MSENATDRNGENPAPRSFLGARWIPGRKSRQVGPTDGGPTAPVVPTKILAILLAILAVLLIHHAMVFLTQVEVLIPTYSVDGARGVRIIDSQFASHAAQDLIIASMLHQATYQALYSGFTYVVMAHFVLRWLKYTTITSYVVGGMCAAFAVVAYGAAFGQRLLLQPIILELVCGAIAALVYRLAAGRKRVRAAGA